MRESSAHSHTNLYARNRRRYLGQMKAEIDHFQQLPHTTKLALHDSVAARLDHHYSELRFRTILLCVSSRYVFLALKIWVTDEYNMGTCSSRKASLRTTLSPRRRELLRTYKQNFQVSKRRQAQIWRR